MVVGITPFENKWMILETFIFCIEYIGGLVNRFWVMVDECQQDLSNEIFCFKPLYYSIELSCKVCLESTNHFSENVGFTWVLAFVLHRIKAAKRKIENANKKILKFLKMQKWKTIKSAQVHHSPYFCCMRCDSGPAILCINSFSFFSEREIPNKFSLKIKMNKTQIA